MAITMTPPDPIKALHWSAVVNGIVAVPVMTVTMMMTAQRKVMGKFVIIGWLRGSGRVGIHSNHGSMRC
jgi:Mn2+/Fe2+ NRAMP family transporter